MIEPHTFSLGDLRVIPDDQAVWLSFEVSKDKIYKNLSSTHWFSTNNDVNCCEIIFILVKTIP